jgi:hypothetical protein
MLYLRPAMPPVKVAPELSPEARELVRVYDSAVGASGPYANPDSLAAVLDRVALLEDLPRLREIADSLRGVRPEVIADALAFMDEYADELTELARYPDGEG